jgi:hypothetical protein
VPAKQSNNMKSLKKIVFPVLAFLITVHSFAQDPIRWNFSSKPLGNNRYELHLTASVQSPWHIYSQSTPAGGPLPVTISFKSNPVVTMEGTVMESGKMITKKEKVFGVDVRYYTEHVDFVQTVKTKVKTHVSGNIKFMLCSDRECLPPKTVKFELLLK